MRTASEITAAATDAHKLTGGCLLVAAKMTKASDGTIKKKQQQRVQAAQKEKGKENETEKPIFVDDLLC